jgi:hypothetical protein
MRWNERGGSRRTTLLLPLLLICTCMALLAVSATASAAPEIGRCVPVEGVKEGKKTVFSGGYKSKNCRKSAPAHNGKYEWLPGAGESPTFETISEEGATLETASGVKIECISGQTFGEVTGATTEKLSFVMAECKEAGTGQTCTTELPEGTEEVPREGVIHSQALKGELGLVEGAKKAGWDVKPETGSLVASFECGAKLTGKQYLVEGSYVDRVKHTNKMTSEMIDLYKQKAGKQIPEKVEGSETDVLSAKFLSGLELRTEAIGLETTEESFPEEEMELRVSTR